MNTKYVNFDNKFFSFFLLDKDYIDRHAKDNFKYAEIAKIADISHPGD